MARVDYRRPDGRLRVETGDGEHTNRARHRMERILGRELEEDEVVHHRNGDPTDDRIENLEVVSREEHASMYHAGADREYPDDHDTPRIPERKIRVIREIADMMQDVNKAEIARAVGVSDMTVDRYL